MNSALFGEIVHSKADCHSKLKKIQSVILLQFRFYPAYAVYRYNQVPSALLGISRNQDILRCPYIQGQPPNRKYSGRMPTVFGRALVENIWVLQSG
jgi:hypothetical protein